MTRGQTAQNQSSLRETNFSVLLWKFWVWWLMLTLIKKKKKSGMMRKKTAQNQTNIGETTLTF